MTGLRISDDLTLPLEAITQAIGILAKRRAGKSYAAAKVAEQALLAGQQVVITDPKGDWWGLRSSADGKHPGLPIVILGGEHADVPLDVTGGETIAHFVVEDRVSVLIDLSIFRKTEVARFMAAFLEALYRLKAQEQYRTPMLLVIDEADAIAPQRPQKGEERMLGAAEDIVRRGGQRGIGCLMVTQRAAVLNKNVLTQIQVLIALRTIAPQDMTALNAWIDVHGTPEQRQELMASLPALPVGTAWVWSPGWPTAAGIFQRVKVARRETFDSSATPRPGEHRVQPRNLADIDLGSLRDRLAATIEKAKADDPRELRRRIAELEKQLRQRPVEVKAEPVVERVEVPVLNGEVDRLIEVVCQLSEVCGGLALVGSSIGDFGREIGGIGESIVRAVAKVQDRPNTGHNVTGHAPNERDLAKPTHIMRPIRQTQKATSNESPNQEPSEITRPQQRILDALASLERLGVDQPSKSNVAVFAEASPTSGAYANNLGRLRSLGLIAYPGPGLIGLTDTGRSQSDSSLRIGGVADLHEAWVRQLRSGPKERILRALIERYPEAIDRGELAALTDASPTSGAYANNLGALRSLGLIDYLSGRRVVATALLFPALP